MIEVTITNNGTNQSQVPHDRMQREEASITFKDIPARDAKFEPTCERHQTNTNQGTIIQITGLERHDMSAQNGITEWVPSL